MAQRPKKFLAMETFVEHLERLGDGLKTGDAKPTSLVPIDWRKVERGYGRQVSADVRQAIAGATNFYILYEESERKGKTFASVRTTIEVFKKRVIDFQKSLVCLVSEPDALGLISYSLNDRNFRGLKLLSEVLALFDDACHAALGQLQNSRSFVKEGDAWRSWIRNLKQIIKNDGLRATARKDVGNKTRSDKQSPFVDLVWELQLCMPTGSRRHMQSKNALADAISEARDSKRHTAKQKSGDKRACKAPG